MRRLISQFISVFWNWFRLLPRIIALRIQVCHGRLLIIRIWRWSRLSWTIFIQVKKVLPRLIDFTRRYHIFLIWLNILLRYIRIILNNISEVFARIGGGAGSRVLTWLFTRSEDCHVSHTYQIVLFATLWCRSTIIANISHTDQVLLLLTSILNHGSKVANIGHANLAILVIALACLFDRRKSNLPYFSLIYFDRCGQVKVACIDSVLFFIFTLSCCIIVIFRFRIHFSKINESHTIILILNLLLVILLIEIKHCKAFLVFNEVLIRLNRLF